MKTKSIFIGSLLFAWLVLPVKVYMNILPESFKSFLLFNDIDRGSSNWVSIIMGILFAYTGLLILILHGDLIESIEKNKLKKAVTSKFNEDIYKLLHTANLSQNTFIFEFVFSGHSIALQMRNRVDGGTGISRWYNIGSNQLIEKKSEMELILKFLNKVNKGDFSEFSTDREMGYSKPSNNYNPYEILGVDESATNDQIRNVWRSLAKIYHPDTGNSPAKEKFNACLSAYETIRKDRNF